MKDGIINVYKPGGMTSNDVIYKVRATLGIKKLGHTGTLDPMAEGVLPILINRGTRITEYLDWDLKTYETVMKLGVRTDSLDITGNVETEEDTSSIIPEDVRQAIAKLFHAEVFEGRPVKFSGVIEQIPPLTSAVRINGRRLYEYVHDREDVPEEIKEKIRPRRVWIEKLEINEINLPEIRFTVTCSKGTYIRSITRDIGEILGTGAVMTSLKRTASGAFTDDNAVHLDELITPALKAGRISFIDEEKTKVKRNVPFGEDIPEDLKALILGVDFPLNHFGEAIVSPEDARRFLDGWHLNYREARVVEEPKRAEWLSMLSDDETEYDKKERLNNIGSHAGIKLHPEYLDSYRIYTTSKNGERIFVGIARHSDKYHKLVPDKVFLRL